MVDPGFWTFALICIATFLMLYLTDAGGAD